MISEIESHIDKYLKAGPADGVGLGIFDFKRNKSFTKQYSQDNNSSPIFFDLASLTKPLTNGLILLKYRDLPDEVKDYANHRGGLPSWGLLGLDYKKQIDSYQYKKSDSLYSDFSAIRFQLEVEKELGLETKNLINDYYGENLIHWLDLTHERTLQNGYKGFKENFLAVHDPNAYFIKEFLHHAGLFADIGGLSKAINSLVSDGLLDYMMASFNNQQERFINSWDTPSRGGNTLAGNGSSFNTFGHLGFTGTSLWIDAQKQCGYFLLSNATKYHWYDKKGLNCLRKKVGEIVWGDSFYL